MKSAVLTSVFALAVSAGAQAAVIDFEADLGGSKPNGFAPVGHPGVTFTDTVGAELSLLTTPIETAGTQALVVFADFDGSALRIDFASPITSLSMSIGNDDSAFVGGAPVFGLLEAFDGAVLVASTLLATNNNDVMDQVIAVVFAGGFNNAKFQYTDGTGSPLTLIEVVDNIAYDAAVPAPGAFALTALGLAMLGWRRSRTN